jgi:hypothetical protein
MGCVHPGVVEILNFDSFGPFKSCGARMHGSQAYTLRKTGRTLMWGSYRLQHGGGGGGANVKTLVTTDETKFKILTFWTY